MRLLIVEDSESLRRSLGEGLRRCGFAVDIAADGEEGLAFAEHAGYDAIVLDLMLPKLDGLELLRRLRAKKIQTHVLVLSARSELRDRIDLLNAGADDFLVKPFAFDELLARLQALVRRRYAEKAPVLAVGGLEIDTVARSVQLLGRRVDLSALEYSLLELLALRRGRVTSRDEILDRLYAVGGEPTSNVVEALIYSLRRKIQQPGAPSFIVTRRGLGYLIEAE
jgi:DNA-binding response OmpR family regulator